MVEVSGLQRSVDGRNQSRVTRAAFIGTRRLDEVALRVR